MSIITVQQALAKKSGYLIPDGGEILWYGSSVLPAGWILDSAINDNFVEGVAEGNATDVIEGANDHAHANSNADAVADHIHSRNGLTTSSYNSTTSQYSASGQNSVAVPNHNHIVPSGNTNSAGGHDHTIPDTQSTTVLPPYARYYWIIAVGDQPVPIGGIIMWDDVLANSPDGFHLCDGDTYDSIAVPDLRERFIYAPSADNEVGDTGGAETHTHVMNDVDADGNHAHSISGNTNGCGTRNGGYQGTQVQKSHSHGISGTTAEDNAHTHAFATPTDPATNIPMFMKLCFLIRTV